MTSNAHDIVPVNFGLKYNPPKIGLQYYVKDQPNAHFVHEIPLGMLSKDTDINDLLSDLFMAHKFYLNPKMVPQAQVKRLLVKLQNHVSNIGDKENRVVNETKSNIETKPEAVPEKKPVQEISNKRPNEVSPLSEKSPQMIESAREDAEVNDLLISDIHHQESKGEDVEQLLKTGAFTKELMMGSTIRDLGSTLKEAKNQQMMESGEQNELEQFCDPNHLGSGLTSHQSSMQEIADSSALQDSNMKQEQPQPADGEEEEEELIDIDNPDELAAKGLKRIQIEGEDEEYLMDNEGNIYDLQGNFIGTTDGDQLEDGSQMHEEGSQLVVDGEEEY